jgi:hypothetical protein
MPRWDSKYRGGCSLVLIGPDRDSRNLWLDWNSNSDSNYNLNIPQAPAPANIFHVFLRKSHPNSTCHGDSLQDFAHLKNATEFLYHVIFATMSFATLADRDPAGGDGLEIEIQPELVTVDLTAWSWNLETMTSIGALNFQDGGSELLLEPQQTQIFPAFPDWEGNAVLGLACPPCTPMLDLFKETGHWMDYMLATVYHMALALNATLELEPIFAIQTDGKDENGNWNAYVAP